MNVTLNTTDGERPSLASNETALEMLYVVLVYTLLEDKGFRFNNPCVGVFLHPNLVLTTLSCLEVSFHGDIDTDLMVVYVRNSQVLKPQKVFVYPDIAGGPNVALIVCETSNVMDFPKLPDKEFKLSDFEYCTLCGFGTESTSIELKAFNTVRISKSQMAVCNMIGHNIKERICLHFDNAIPCRGDVGAPLLCNGALHAIFNPPVAPWAPPKCMDAYGATFTLMHPVVPWIQKVNNSMEVPVYSRFVTPWYWVALVVTSLTFIVIIYYLIMKIVDWRCDRDEVVAVGAETGPRVIYVRDSEMSRVTTTRWMWQR